MRFYQIDSFKQHLKSTSLEHLSHFFLLVVPSDSERRKASQWVKETIEHHYPKIDFLQTHELGDVLSHLASGSLFGDAAVVLFEPEKPLTEEQINLFMPLSSHHFLILALKEKQEVVERFYLKAKKQVELLDMSAEKPWEMQNRLKRSAQEYLALQSQRFSQAALELIFEKVAPDAAFVEQELDKLIQFTAGRAQIERADVEQLTSDSKKNNLWQVAQQLVWEMKAEAVEKALEIGDGIGLIYPLRQQIELGWIVAFGLEQKWSDSEIAKELPQLKPKALAEHTARARELGLPFFKAAWEALYECELALKNYGEERTLLYLFLGRLHALKDALSAA